MASASLGRALNSRLSGTDEYRLKNVTIKTFLSDPGVHQTCNFYICTFAQLYIVNSVFTQITIKKNRNTEPVPGEACAALTIGAVREWMIVLSQSLQGKQRNHALGTRDTPLHAEITNLLS